MRMRRKPWARPELEACPFYKNEPALHRGSWSQAFSEQQPMHLELGCGKGHFLSQLAPQNPCINYIAVDIKSEMLGLAKRKIEAAYAATGQQVNNVLLMSQDIERIHMMLAPEDAIERIYINFCNPWPRERQHKKRLTHVRQLLKYREFLIDGGEIHFKTDDDDLFEDSVLYAQQAGFTISFLTRDLHQSGYAPNWMTEHEVLFSSQGIPIKFFIARKGPLHE